MLPRFIPLLLIPLVSVAQEPIPFMISATPCSFCLVTNEYVQWMVSIEPEGNCLYDWSDCVEIPEFESLPGGDGTTFLNYSTAERGKHHLLLVEKETGRELAYAIIYIDYHILSKYSGVPLDVFDSRKLSANSFNDKYATWAPTKANDVPGLFDPGLLVPYDEWPGRITVLKMTD